MTPVTQSSLSEIVSRWGGRNVVAIVDLDAVATNVKTLRSIVGPHVKLMAVVKANGYGHDAIPIAQTVLGSGADLLGVATVDEGAQLRAEGVKSPILVLGAIGKHERGRAIRQRLSLVVSNVEFARALAIEATASLIQEPVSVHLKIDTGMRRFGSLPAEVVEIAKAIHESDKLHLDGVMTHMASADAVQPTSAHDQEVAFERCLAAIREAGIDIPARHVCNSAGTLRFPEYHKEMVRVGIALYGLVPDRQVPLPGPMKPILTIHGQVARVFDLQPGDTVGYGETYVSPGNEQAALITIGYADGYRRGLSSAGWMSIRGQRAEVLGRVSMDQTVVRVPSGLTISPGEPVVVVGDGSSWTAGAPTLDDLAELFGTIGYEMATGLARRLPRLYVEHGRVVGVSDLAGYREL